MRRIAFAGDCLRFRLQAEAVVSGQAENLAWLRGLLAGMASWKGAGVETRSFGTEAIAKSFAEAGADHGRAEYIADPESAWARRYDVALPDVLRSMFDEIASHDLIVGFELPPTLRRYLNNHGTPYINLVIHPLRFLRDLPFGVTTNSPPLQALLAVAAVPIREIEASVRRYRALFAKKHPPAVAIPGGLPVLIGQTDKDSVLIRAGDFAQWSDFEAELAEYLDPYPEVVFIAHPMGTNATQMAGFLRSRLGKTVVSTDANGYGVIFSEPGPPLALTLSSSLGVEAEAAGLRSRFLVADPRLKLQVPDIDVGPMECVGHAILDDPFWRAVFERTTLTLPASDAFHLGEHFVRDSVESWSFRPLRTGLLTLTARKTLFAGANLTNHRFAELLAALAGRPHETLADPRSTIDAAPASGVDLVAVVPLDLNESRTFTLGAGSGAPSLGEGFHPTEDWGCWSREFVCAIRLPISDEAAAAGAILDICMPVRVFAGLLPHSPVLKISHAGVTCAYACFRPSTGDSLLLRFQVRTTGTVCGLNFELSRLDSPACGGGADTRWLGLAVTTMDVTCKPGHQAEAGADGTRPVVFGIHGDDAVRLTAPAMVVS